MKKLVLSLLGAATLATASNAMALDTSQIYPVQIATRGLRPTFAGAVVFDFDSEDFSIPIVPSPGGPVAGAPGHVFPGSCVYSAEWISNASNASTPYDPLTLSAQCFVAEQKIHGNSSCMMNAYSSVPSTLSIANPLIFGDCFGFTPFGQLNKVLFLQLGEVFWPKEALTGIIQFDSYLPNHTVYGVQLG